MAKVFVGIGSNIERRLNVVSSVRCLAECFDQLRVSPIYESRAEGFEGEDFYNLVVSFHTVLLPRQVADVLAKVERDHQRWRVDDRFVSRTLDLDQLLYDDVVLNVDGIQLPHGDITVYAHVLLPLARLAVTDKHPVLKKTYAQLWRERSHMAPALQEVTLPELSQFG